MKSSPCPEADPYAASFLRDQLGDEKWEIFSSRLFERRFSANKPSRSRKSRGDSEEGDAKAPGASAIDFLVKVEVVKEILRTYVPYVIPACISCFRIGLTIFFLFPGIPTTH